MSGSVSGSQMSFIPRAPLPDEDSPIPAPSQGFMGQAGREFEGIRSLAPHAAGAYSTSDKATAFRGDDPYGDRRSPMALGAGTKGSWLFKNDG